MFATRSAIMLLVGCIFLSPSAQASQSTQLSAKCAGVFAACQPTSSVDWQVLAPAPPDATLAQFAPWRARIKSVLGDTDHKMICESDLGPALVPRLLIDLTLLPLTSCRLPIIVPLRC